MRTCPIYMIFVLALQQPGLVCSNLTALSYVMNIIRLVTSSRKMSFMVALVKMDDLWGSKSVAHLGN